MFCKMNYYTETKNRVKKMYWHYEYKMKQFDSRSKIETVS
jgi:hypothetical protein